MTLRNWETIVRYHVHRSRKAVWSQRIGALFLLLFVVAFVLHRFGPVIAPFAARLLKQNGALASYLVLSTPVALRLLAVAVAGAALAFALGVIAMVNIWREGYLGAGKAFAGVFFSMLVLAAPAATLPSLVRLPRIHEISTDTRSPPVFSKLAKKRQGEANSAAYQAAEAAEQAKAYPDIRPLTVNHSADVTYDAVREVAHGLQWKIVLERPPEGGGAGVIEAVDRSPIFGFADDVVIRVSGDAKTSRLDMRSSARFGDHDLGRNAERVREVLAKVRTRVAKIDKDELIERLMKRRAEQARKAAASGKCTRRRRRAGQCGKNGAASGSGKTNSIETQEETAAAPDRDAAPALSPQEAQDEPRPTRRRRRTRRQREFHTFWEELLE
jgi:uncharacterized protein (DUF1499 family)